jgi:ERCC4-type nuclease
MDDFLIAIDDREHVIVEEFRRSASGIPFAVKRLNAGDFAVFYREHLLIVLERKTWADLAATIKDADRRNNYKDMLKLRETSGCYVGYLIEGKQYPNPKSSVGHMEYSSLIAHLDHRMMEDQMLIFYCKDPEHCVERIYAIIKNYQTMKSNRIKEINDLVEGGETKESQKIFAPKVKSDDAVVYKMYEAVRGITDKTATLLIDAKITLQDIILGKVAAQDIAALRYPSGAILGDKRAANITQISKTHLKSSVDTFVKILSRIPTITKTTAEKLLETYHITTLMCIDPLELAKFPKTDKAVIGKKSAETFVKFIGVEKLKLDVLKPPHVIRQDSKKPVRDANSGADPSKMIDLDQE